MVVSMSQSKAQKFASKRNVAPGRIKGIMANIADLVNVATKKEEFELGVIVGKLSKLKEEWSDNYEEAKDRHL